MYHYVSSKNSLNAAIFSFETMSEARVTLLIRVSSALKSRLSEIAKRERRSLSKQVELILERSLEASNPEPVDSHTQKVSRRKPPT